MTPIPNMGVYAIEHLPSGRLYVGRSANLKQRLQEHRREMKLGRPGTTPLLSDLCRDGYEAFAFHILQRTVNELELGVLEAYWIDALGTLAPAGYNEKRASRYVVRSDTQARRDRKAITALPAEALA